MSVSTFSQGNWVNDINNIMCTETKKWLILCYTTLYVHYAANTLQAINGSAYKNIFIWVNIFSFMCKKFCRLLDQCVIYK